MKTFKRVLVVRANGDCRVLSADRFINLRLDEVGFNLEVSIPDTWGHMHGLIGIELPDPPTPEAIVKILMTKKEAEDAK